ncbi:MAG: hypothetical protein ACRDUY_01460 [Nitriliruptorales bacterium]
MSPDPIRLRGRLTRRDVLRGAGLLGAAGVLAACGAGRDGNAAGETPTAGGQPTGDTHQAILDKLGIDAPRDLVVVIPAAEFLVGEDRRMQFGLATQDREFISGLEGVEVTVVADEGLEPVDGPAPVRVHDRFGQLGVYSTEVSFPSPGVYWIVAAAPDRVAVNPIRAIPPEQSPVPQVGEPIPSETTPTFDDPMEFAEVCTRDPDCSMHDVSLDDALAAGRPIVLTVATPLYCQTAICGPVVDVIDGVKQDVGRDDVAWIHVEVFTDAGNTPADLVNTLGLPSEPWTFFIGADGKLADKLEGPTPEELVREILDKI